MSFSAQLPALQVVVPLLIAPLVVLLRPRGTAWAAATATSAMTFAIALTIATGVLDGQTYTYAMGSWPAPYGIALGIDAFGSLILLLVTGASTFALLAGRRSTDADIEQQRQPLFYTAWLLALAGLSGIAVSADAFNIFVFMEISSLASYIIVAGGPDRRTLPAVFKYLIMGTIGATFYLIGIGLIYMMTGTLNLSDMQARLGEVTNLDPVLAAAGFITIGLALKAAIFPLHVWLPNAYAYAPHAVTAFLAACGTKVALYVLLRFDFFVFQSNLAEHDAQFSLFLLPLALLGILIASGVAVFESNLKRLLAFSSVAQVGYIVLGASLVTVTGLTAGILHMFNHALAKGGLFLSIAGLALAARGLERRQLGGLARQMPWTFGAFVIAALSLIGIPGTAGFISKWYLIQATLDHGALGIVAILVIIAGSLLAVAYVWRIIETASFGTPDGQVPASREAPSVLLAVTWLVAILNIYFGVRPEAPAELSRLAAEKLLAHLL